MTDTKQRLDFSQVRCFRFEAEHSNTMFVKHYLNEPFKSVNIGKRGVQTSKFPTCSELPLKYNSFIAINPKKLANLKALLPYIPPVYHGFYRELGVENVQLSNGDIEDDNVEHFDDNDDVSDDV